MVSDTPEPDKSHLNQALTLRAQACDLLQRLIEDRRQSEQRMAEAGKRDAMKSVTGRTAFDAAIRTTQDMIGQMDALLAEPCRPEATPEVTPELTIVGRVRPASRSRLAKPAVAMAAP